MIWRETESPINVTVTTPLLSGRVGAQDPGDATDGLVEGGYTPSSPPLSNDEALASLNPALTVGVLQRNRCLVGGPGDRQPLAI